MAVARVGCTPGTYHVLAGSAMKEIPALAHPRLAVTEPAVRAFGALVVGLPLRTENSRKRGHVDTDCSTSNGLFRQFPWKLLPMK